MNEQEKKYIRQIIERALADGCVCSVNDGEEYTVIESRDVEAILAALGTTEEDHLVMYNNIGRTHVGSVYLVYGNEPDEVVNDWGASSISNESRMIAIVGEYQS